MWYGKNHITNHILKTKYLQELGATLYTIKNKDFFRQTDYKYQRTINYEHMGTYNYRTFFSAVCPFIVYNCNLCTLLITFGKNVYCHMGFFFQMIFSLSPSPTFPLFSTSCSASWRSSFSGSSTRFRSCRRAVQESRCSPPDPTLGGSSSNMLHTELTADRISTSQLNPDISGLFLKYKITSKVLW